MATYRVIVPFIDDMGTVSPIVARESFGETAPRCALWHLNSMRDHDGLPHLSRMPAGTRYERLPEPKEGN